MPSRAIRLIFRVSGNKLPVMCTSFPTFFVTALALSTSSRLGSRSVVRKRASSRNTVDRFELNFVQIPPLVLRRELLRTILPAGPLPLESRENFKRVSEAELSRSRIYEDEWECFFLQSRAVSEIFRLATTLEIQIKFLLLISTKFLLIRFI